MKLGELYPESGFNPKFVAKENGEPLFGYIVREQGINIFIILKIYDEKNKDRIAKAIGSKIDLYIKMLDRPDIQNVYFIDSKEMLRQLNDYNIEEKMISNNKIDIVIEVTDLITDTLVPLGFTMKFAEGVDQNIIDILKSEKND